MKIKYPDGIDASIAIACRLLLEEVHVAELDVIVFVCLVTKARKKTVLVEIIIDDFFSKIDVYFII